MNKVFFDSDQSSNGFGESDFMNHPGLFGITWSKKKAEADRVAEAKSSLKSKCPHSSSMNCDKLDKAIKCLKGQKNSWSNASTSSKGARRVRSRHLDILNPWISTVNGWIDARDCDGDSSPVDDLLLDVDDLTAENVDLTQDVSDTEKEAVKNIESIIAGSKAQLADFQMRSEQEKNTLMYVGGGVVAILLLVLIIKK